MSNKKTAVKSAIEAKNIYRKDFQILNGKTRLKKQLLIGIYNYNYSTSRIRKEALKVVLNWL